MNRSSRMHSPVLLSLMLVAGCGYNTIQTLDERVNQAQGQIQTQLQRRSDLIPNLVETAKVERLHELVVELRELHRGLGAQLELTGPWPPYNFVTGLG